MWIQTDDYEKISQPNPNQLLENWQVNNLLIMIGFISILIHAENFYNIDKSYQFLLKSP